MATQVVPVKFHSASMREALEKELPFVLAVRPSEDGLCRTLRISWGMSEEQARAAARLLVAYEVPEGLGETPLGELIGLQVQNIGGTWQYLASRHSMHDRWSFDLYEYRFGVDLTFTFTWVVRSTSGYISPSVPARVAGFYIPTWKKDGTYCVLLLKEDGSVETLDIVVYPRMLEIGGVPYHGSPSLLHQ